MKSPQDRASDDRVQPQLIFLMQCRLHVAPTQSSTRRSRDYAEPGHARSAVRILADDLGEDIGIKQVFHFLLVRRFCSLRGRCLARAVTISFTCARKGSSWDSHPRTEPSPCSAG